MPAIPFSAEVRGVDELATIPLHGDVNVAAEAGLGRRLRRRCVGAGCPGRPPRLHRHRLHQQHRHRAHRPDPGRRRRDRREVRACGLSPHYVEIFEITRLSDYMRIFDDQASARPRTRGHHRRGTMTTGTTTVEVRPLAAGASAIAIAGDVTSASEGPLMDAYTQASAAGAKVIVLDFSRLDYMNSGGIGLLVTLLVRVQRAGPAADGRRPQRALPPDPVAHPPRRGHRDPRHRGRRPSPPAS